MKVLSKSEGYLSIIERYNLNDVYSESELNKGLIICYTLAVCTDTKLVSLDINARHEEIGVQEKWHKKYFANSFSNIFSSIDNFLEAFNIEDFGRWRVIIIYQNIEIAISGEKDETEIAISYDKKLKLNLLPLFSNIETKTYEFNNCDEKIVNILENEFRMTEKRAILSIQKLQTHMDIYEEFVLAITTGERELKNAIKVEGFTAEQLKCNYPLSILGAYNYLIYLRECPVEALKDLKRGLPRK